MRTLGVALAAAAILCLAHAPARAGETRRVIELFTSQGCSSCPPADKLAAQLARRPDTVMISMPVDYWDYLGWKDSFSKAAFTARQKAYSKARGDMQVYTPQAVIDGVAHAVGSEEDAIQAAAEAAHAPDVPISATLVDAKVKIGVAGSQAGAAQAEVWLVPILSSATVGIGRGENAGATITYTNIARDIVKLGDWDGGKRDFDLAVADIRKSGADGAAILLQQSKGGLPGAILGAAIVKLK